MSTGNMPPLPSLDESMIQRSPEEEKSYRSGMGAMTLTGHPQDFKDSYLGQRLTTLHKMHVDTAKRHYGNIQNYYYTLDSGKNPQTGQDLTDEERQTYQNQLDGTWDDLLKTPGLDKDAKAELQARRDMMSQVLTHGRTKVAATALGMMPPPPDQRATTQTAPSPTDVPAGAATSPDFEAQSWGQGGPAAAAPTPAPAPQGVGGMPPLPQASASPSPSGPPPQVLPGDMLNPFISSSIAQSATTAAEIAKRRAELQSSGTDPNSPAGRYFMLKGQPAPISGTSTTYINPATGQTFTGQFASGIGVLDETGEVVPGATKATGEEQKGAEPYPKSPTERPYGIKKGTNITLEADLTGPDKDLLKASQRSYDERQDLIKKRQEEASDRYAEMRGKVTQYYVWDKASGSAHMANSNLINQDPNRYMMASGPAGGQQQSNRAVALQEIQNSTNVLERAIDNLNDSSDWDLGTLTTLQTALREPNDALVGSKVLNAIAMGQAAGSLTPQQAEYAMAILNARESVMRIGVVAALGQGATDKMRDAVVGMLPSGTTPNKSWAKRQLALTNQQFDIFSQAIPSAESLGLGHPNGSGGSSGAGAAGASRPPKPTTPLAPGKVWGYSPSRKVWMQGKEEGGRFVPDAGQ